MKHSCLSYMTVVNNLDLSFLIRVNPPFLHPRHPRAILILLNSTVLTDDPQITDVVDVVNRLLFSQD